ncbi:MAG: hypothetical protein CEN90_204 [Parcubacteria group bacterium Licking1014_17]|nr:MAG: hypothetical protein CEN90_204 [Parcubacteria group bacterium Licking1014_17]
MRENEKTNYDYIVPMEPPHGLFSRIIRRLGLEKRIRLVKRHLGVFIAAAAVFLFLSIFAFIGLKEVLSESSFGPYLSLIYSDPGIVIKYWQSFILSLLESMPGSSIVIFLIPLTFVLLFVKFVGSNYEKFVSLIKSTRNKK